MDNENQIEDTEAGLDAPSEDSLNFDAKAVEKQLIEVAQARAEDPSETAATAYSMYVPHYKRILPKLSTRSLRRVLNYMVLYPLEQGDIKPTSELEKEVMQLVNSLVEAKFVMIMHQYSKHAEEMYNAQQAALTEEQKSEVVENLREAGVTEEEIQKLVEQNKES